MMAQATTMSDWIVVAIVFAVSVTAVALSRRLVRTLSGPLGINEYAGTVILRIVTVAVGLVALTFVLGQLNVEVGPLLGALGVSGILLAMALQPVLGNLVGALLIHARRPLKPGDQIISNGHAGTVIDVTGRAVVMVTFDGETVYLPNLKVLEEPLVNQTASPYRRTVMPFSVPYGTDLRETIRSTARAIRKVDALGEAPPADVLVTGFEPSGITMVARFWHPSEELSARFAISEVAVTLRETLDEIGVGVPYPRRLIELGPGANTVVDDGGLGQPLSEPDISS